MHIDRLNGRARLLGVDPVLLLGLNEHIMLWAAHVTVSFAARPVPGVADRVAGVLARLLGEVN